MKKKKSVWNLLNPLAWFEAAFSLLAWVFGPILRFLGMMPHPPTTGFQNIDKADVEEAAADAENTQEAIDAILREMSPAEVVHAYANAAPDSRIAMDLSVIDEDGQNWLLNLSDDDLTLLAMSTVGGCARSLESRAVIPTYPRPSVNEKEAEILTIPTPEDIEEQNRQLIAERFRAELRALSPRPGNLNPKYTPMPTLH
ncbi:hypothetical protein [Agrobacterium tumefaciens]|uniref:hypothetical protein n=1 Tax=Agrobacterium tumefaciens TaxID=358 RepID=UPI002861731E|nr:hypothetical protein [Agrobacterium tumefaciens]MDR6587440.1 hypothetical protein [Agrobacterium tumefaciens]